MSLYKVITTCHFKNRYWNQGEIADFPEDTDVNEHFEAFKGHVDESKVVEVLPEPATMSEINQLRKQKQPKTGMGYTKEAAIKEVVVEKKKPGPKPKAKATA